MPRGRSAAGEMEEECRGGHGGVLDGEQEQDSTEEEEEEEEEMR